MYMSQEVWQCHQQAKLRSSGALGPGHSRQIHLYRDSQQSRHDCKNYLLSSKTSRLSRLHDADKFLVISTSHLSAAEQTWHCFILHSGVGVCVCVFPLELGNTSITVCRAFA